MRPRHKAAENKRAAQGIAHPIDLASMRPRHKAAENRRWPDAPEAEGYGLQ